MAVDKNGNTIVIGKNPTTTGGTSKTNTSNQPLAGFDAAVNLGLGNVGVNTVKVDTSVDNQNWVLSLTKKDMNRIIPWLKKFGASKTNIADYESAKNYLQTNYDTYLTNSGHKVDTLLKMFSENVTAFAGSTSATPAETLPQRTISKLDPAVIGQLVDSIYLSTIGKAATPEQIKQHIAEFESMNTGTVTSYKKVKNPDTGKMENVTTVTPGGFTQDVAKKKLEEQLKKSNPLEYQRRKAFEFSDALNQVLSGGI